MLGRTHIVFSLFLGLIYLYFSSADYIILLFFIFGSLFPDIDTKTSYLGRKSNISWLFSHRGFFHSIFALIIFSFILDLFFPRIMTYSFAIAYFSHLFLDSFNKKGIAFFIFEKRVKGNFLSGGLFDKFLFWLFLFANIILVLSIGF